MKAGTFLGELKRRNVVRAGALYAASVWAFGQGLSQFSPALGLPDWATRWFLVAAFIGFPFWLAFAWLYEITPGGLKRESEIAPDDSMAHSSGKRFDRWIIAIMAVAIILLVTNTVVLRRDATGTATAADAKTLAAELAKVPAKSIAVLPLVNESYDPREQYFSDGLSEELISALGQVRQLRVIGRNSSFRFRGKAQDDSAGIGANLEVATLLEGTVRKQGNEVLIVVSLIKAADGSQLWSQTYDRDLKDVFAVQSDIATSVADALQAGVFGQVIEATDKPPSGDLAAYDAMLQGRYYAERRNRADYAKAVGYYQQAIALDPDYALAYARLAIAQLWFNDWVANDEERKLAGAKARANAQRAVALAPNSAVALGALGVVQAWTDFDYPAAEATLRKAVALDPSNAMTLYQLADVTFSSGQFSQALAMMHRALTMEPLNASFHYYTGVFLLNAGRSDEAEVELRRAIQLQPGAEGYASTLGLALLEHGQFDKALETVATDPSGQNRRWASTMIYWARGDKTRAQAELDEMIRLDGNASPGLVAVAYAFEGNTDQAFAWLDRAVQKKDPVAVSIYEQMPEALATFIRDPRFAAFSKKFGISKPNEPDHPFASGLSHD